MPTEKNKKTGLNKTEIIIENMKRGFDGLESQTYQDYNVTTGAMGFYQYVPSQWLKQMKEFAKKNEFLMNPNDIPAEAQWEKDRYQKDANGKYITKDGKKVPLTIEQGQIYFSKILENKAFQDEFFKYDMTALNKMNQAKELYNKYADSTGYSLEGFVGAVHYLGIGGAKELLKKAQNDPSVLDKRTNFNNKKSLNEYATEVTTNIQNRAGVPSRDKGYDVNGDPIKGSNAKMTAFKEQYQKIKNSSLSDAAREQSYTNLFNAVGSAGYQKEMDQFIVEDDQNLLKEQKDFQEGKDDGSFIHKIIQDPSNTLKLNKDGSYEIHLNGENREDEWLRAKKLDDKNLVTGFSSSTTPGNDLIMGTKNAVVGAGKLIKDAGYFIDDAVEFMIDPIGATAERSARLKEEANKKSETAKAQTYIIKGKSAANLFTTANNKIKKITGGEGVYFEKDEQGKSILKSPIIYKKDAQAINEIIKNTSVKTEPIDWTQYDKTIIPKATDLETTTSTSDKKTDETSTTKTEIDPSKIKRLNEEADSYFNRFKDVQEMDIPDVWKYDVKNYKREMPWEALSYGAMGLIGMGDAKTPLPERTDEISGAILSYTNNLKRMSEMGLKPEEEAKLKDDLAGAYQESLDNLVRASNGNRNVVLGNMGTLNKNRLDAIGNMAMMDVMKKDAAYEKYGKALEYVQNFNTTKAMDNHKIKLDAAKEKRAAGAALASTGFASMLAELQHQKDNGPGSMNHQYMKSMMVHLTGIDSDIIDKGDGSQPFTLSNNKKLKAEAFAKTNALIQTRDKEQLNRDTWAAKPEAEKNKYENYIQFVNEQNKPDEARPNPFTKLYEQMKPVNYVERYDPTQEQVEVPKQESVYPLDEQFPYFNNTIK